jgi:putative PIN family toxin of toxin-antitoxin system
MELFARYVNSVTIVPQAAMVRECRDPKDDKFLELALDGQADLLVTGDEDLLALHPWRGIPILSPADYLART